MTSFYAHWLVEQRTPFNAGGDWKDRGVRSDKFEDSSCNNSDSMIIYCRYTTGQRTDS
jgi:hypothetical protein